ncbi:MAG: TVP38/TMEM64 family protein [Bacilli bacterium]|nr:TVP38/TMEM64 family protein [Bacilli bacterium]
MGTIQNLIDTFTNLISNGGLFAGFFIVFLECFIPALPLSVFVALNVNAFGFVVGVLLSWSATCLGGFLCYTLFYQLEDKLLERIFHKERAVKLRSKVEKFQKIPFSFFVVLITLPFTPSSLINILSGLSKMPRNKYIVSILIGKLFMILFWGYVGLKVLGDITDIKSLIFIGIGLVLSYVISRIVNKKMDIE